MESDVIFVHFDIKDSGLYTEQIGDKGRDLSTALAKWTAKHMQDYNASQSKNRGGDAANIVFKKFDDALTASLVLRNSWSNKIQEFKDNLNLSKSIAIHWPGFRILMAKDTVNNYPGGEEILDDNMQVWESLTSLKIALPPNIILCRDNVVPDQTELERRFFHRISNEIKVRKGKSHDNWRCWVLLDSIRLDATEFDGELLASNAQSISANNVKITANLNYSTVTDQGFNVIKRVAQSWEPNHEIWHGTAPREVTEAFNRKNRERCKDSETLKIRPETSKVPLVRLIADPVMKGNNLDLQVAPLSWELYSTI